MEFVRLENDDGDAIHAALYGSTNHPGTDVQFVDIDSGETWSAQLKATDDASYVQDWIDSHPDGEILVTSELAARMDLSPSGLSNEHLTARTEDVVDQLLEAGSDSDLWDYFPALTVASIALVVWELWTRHCKGEITLSQFKWMTAKVSGLKAGKLALLSVAMMIPGINVVTGAGLVASLLFSAAHAVKAVTEAKRLP